MTLNPLQTDVSAADAFIETASAFGQKYWWVAVLIALAWYLRWYAYAWKRDMEGAAYLGFYAAVRHIGISLKNAGKFAVFLITGALIAGAYIFDLTWVFASLLPVLDPLAWAITALMAFIGLEAFDASFVNLGNAVLVFFGTLFVLFLIQRFGDSLKRQAAEERERSFAGRIGATLRGDSASTDRDQSSLGEWED